MTLSPFGVQMISVFAFSACGNEAFAGPEDTPGSATAERTLRNSVARMAQEASLRDRRHAGHRSIPFLDWLCRDVTDRYSFDAAERSYTRYAIRYSE